jgi:hypothetical protein
MVRTKLSDRRERVATEVVEEYGFLLKERGEDEGVASEVDSERFARPPAHGLDDVEGDSFEKVVEGTSDAEAVALQVWHVGVCLFNGLDALDDFLL